MVDVDPRLGRDQYQLLYGAPGGPADRFVASTLARTTSDDLAVFTVYTPYGPNRAEAQALVDDMRNPTSVRRAAGRRDRARRRRRG